MRCFVAWHSNPRRVSLERYSSCMLPPPIRLIDGMFFCALSERLEDKNVSQWHLLMRCTPSLRACHQCPTHPRTIALDHLAPHPPHHELLRFNGSSQIKQTQGEKWERKMRRDDATPKNKSLFWLIVAPKLLFPYRHNKKNINQCLLRVDFYFRCNCGLTRSQGKKTWKKTSCYMFWPL